MVLSFILSSCRIISVLVDYVEIDVVAIPIIRCVKQIYEENMLSVFGKR
jgi:hypothetical protein